MSKESIFSHTLCIFYELPHGLDLLAKLIKPRTEHRSAHLNCIAISLNDGIDSDRILIGHCKCPDIAVIDIEDSQVTTCLAHHTHRLGIGIARETASIVEQLSHGLGALHLIFHRTLHLALDGHKTVV